MYQIGTQDYKRYKYVLHPILFLLFCLSLLYLFIWSAVLPFTHDNSKDAHDVIATVLWCIWGLTVAFLFTVVFLSSDMVKTEAQTHLILLTCWSSVFGMTATLFLHVHDGNKLVDEFYKTFISMANISMSTIFVCRTFPEFLISTAMNVKRIAVTIATIVFVSASLGFLIYSRESITVLLTFLVPTLVSVCMILRRRCVSGMQEMKGEINQQSLTIVLLTFTLLTIPYLCKQFVTFDETVTSCLIRISLWKCFTVPIVLGLSNAIIHDRLFSWAFDNVITKSKETEKTIPVSRRRNLSESSGSRIRRYGSTHRSSLLVIVEAPIVEEDDEDNMMKKKTDDSKERQRSKSLSNVELSVEQPLNKRMNSIVEIDVDA